MATSAIIHVIGNLGSPDHLGLLLDYTLHAAPEVRNSAIEALRSLPADAPLPPKHAAFAQHARRLVAAKEGQRSSDESSESRGSPSRRRLWDGLAPHELPPSAPHLSAAAVSRMERLHAKHRVTGLFGHRVLAAVNHDQDGSASDGPPSCGGSDDGGDDVESHILAILSGADVPLETKAIAVDVLHNLRPLRPCTIDFLLHFYSSHLSHIGPGFSKDLCIAQCVTRKAECRVISHSRCKGDCAQRCLFENQLASAIGALLDGRLRKERRMSRADISRRALGEMAGKEANGEEFEPESAGGAAVQSSPALRAAAARLRSRHLSLAGFPRPKRASHDELPTASRGPRVLLRHQTAAALKVSATSSSSFGARRLWAVDVETPTVEVEEDDTEAGGIRRLKSEPASPFRRANFRTPDGYAPTRLMYAARRLGPLTLFECELLALLPVSDGVSYGRFPPRLANMTAPLRFL